MNKDERQLDKDLHKGHRSRLRNKYMKNGLGDFEDHQIVELLLFESIPRADTNELAHRLIDRFGSLFGVLTASADELVKVQGIGASSAAVIRLAREAMKRAMTEELASAPLDSVAKLEDYMIWQLLGDDADTTVAVFLDGDGAHIDTVRFLPCEIASGELEEKLAAMSADSIARKIALAHTHGGASVEPSPDDLNATGRLIRMLSERGISLDANIIVSGLKAKNIIPMCAGEKLG